MAEFSSELYSRAHIRLHEFSVWQVHRYVPCARHTVTAVGIGTALDGFQQKKELFGEHLRIPLAIWVSD